MTTSRIDRVDVSTPTGGPRVLTGITLVTLTLFAAYSGVLSVLLPQQVEMLDPEGKVGSLALVTSLSFAVTAFAQPLLGALSDRTRTRWGRRIPWMIAGAVVGGVALGLTGSATSVGLLAVGWAVAQFALNGTDIASSAYLVDRFPPRRRGSVSAVIGVAVVVGGAVGVTLAGRFSGSGWAAYAILGAGVLAAVLIFAALVRDPPLPATDVPRPRLRPLVTTIMDAVRTRSDFVKILAWRLCFTLAHGAVYGYLLYLLTDYIGVSEHRSRDLIALLTVAGGAGLVVAVVAGGWLSDRLGRRAPFLHLAAALVVAGEIVAVVAPTVPGVFCLAIALGAALGLSIACGTALGSEVISHPQDNAGRGLGTLNLAGNVGQAVAPVLGAIAIFLTDDYRSLFAISIAAVVAGSAILTTLRTSR